MRVEPGGFTKVSALGVEEQRTRVILELDAPHDRWAALGDAYRVEVEFVLQRNPVFQGSVIIADRKGARRLYRAVCCLFLFVFHYISIS